MGSRGLKAHPSVLQWVWNLERKENYCMKKLKLYGINGGEYALVDDDIYEKVSWYPWKLEKNGYPRAHTIRLHEVVMGARPSDKYYVDHINRDKLDNRRENLRFVDASTSQFNRDTEVAKSGHRGVVVRANRLKPYWVAVYKHGKTIYIGSYKTLDEAVIARKEAEITHGIPTVERPRGSV